MKNIENIKLKEFETERLLIKRPTMSEQHDLWNILKDEQVNKLYFPTPGRFNGNRKLFLEELNDWSKQEKWYKLKIDNLDDNSNIFTWSIFYKENKEVIGQITCQPKDGCNVSIRDVGWFIYPKYQHMGLAYEAASAVIDYMFNDIEIDEIRTCAASTNIVSWKLMEKLGFERIGEEDSQYDDVNQNYVYSLTKEMIME